MTTIRWMIGLVLVKVTLMVMPRRHPMTRRLAAGVLFALRPDEGRAAIDALTERAA